MFNSEKNVDKNDLRTAEDIAEELRLVRDRLEKITQRLARGTRDLYWVGDNGPTTDLKRVVTRALKVKGWTLQELSEITGARRNRISGVLVKLQVDGVKVVNEGDGYRAVWRIR